MKISLQSSEQISEVWTEICSEDWKEISMKQYAV